ncbi:hexokinase-2-like [Salvelinus namaycush]|uniref:hexokinase n=1 Tax=Salvelinus namaycush TaxID=8040 RepID=A0A8U0QJB1_SALNM|nr:hexokinase-2-like [Salvelinus namaycush]
MEEMRNIERVEGEDRCMCINTECGGFGDDGSLEFTRTEFDKTLNSEAQQTFEKMIGGKYLGEIARLVLMKLNQLKLFERLSVDKGFVFETKYISDIEKAWGQSLTQINASASFKAQRQRKQRKDQEILTCLKLPFSLVDCEIVYLVCKAVSKRAAKLCAAGLATIGNCIRGSRGLDKLCINVGVDGSVYTEHPKFSERLKETVAILAPKCKLTFHVSEDGSRRGAAILAAMTQGRADQPKQVEVCLQPFRLSVEKLQDVSSRLRKDMIRGLGKHTHCRAPVKMLPTFVRAIPDGREKGDFLALDLGGTNFRVLRVRVVEEMQKLLKMDSKICAIPQEIMLGTGEQLFDHIAACLAEFLESLELKDQTLPLGFTFSFPCEQKDIDKSILIHWTKGFNCSGVVGEDVVRLLREAIHRRGDYDIGSVAMVNDTVGTMMSCGYRDQSCEIGMIIGTGTNACYMEEIKNVKRVEGEDGRMCINTEWGGFGDDGSLKDIQTEFDLVVDGDSLNPGVHVFEKMISGMYLGEIARLVLVKLARDKLLFGGDLSVALLTQDSFETRFISEIEEENTGLQKAQEILSELDLTVGPVDCQIVRLVCDSLSTRSAQLCATALATIANRIRVNRGLDHLSTTVGVDGTVYKKHPNFSEKLQETVRILAPKCDITYLVSDDGSGKGAAMVTAVAQRLAMQSRILEDIDGEEEEEDQEN